MKIVRFDMGTANQKYDAMVRLNVAKAMNIRQEALEAARQVSNRYLEKTLGKNFHLRLKVYPFHVLRENPLATGAGADRVSTGMKLSYGKAIGCAARMRQGQTVFELRVDKQHLKEARESLERAATKLPCSCKVVAS